MILHIYLHIRDFWYSYIIIPYYLYLLSRKQHVHDVISLLFKSMKHEELYLSSGVICASIQNYIYGKAAAFGLFDSRNDVYHIYLIFNTSSYMASMVRDKQQIFNLIKEPFTDEHIEKASIEIHYLLIRSNIQ